MINWNTNDQMIIAKIVIDKLKIYIISHKVKWLKNKDSTFWMIGSDITCSVLNKSG